MGLRYLLLGLGAVIILLILWDGIRRNRRAMQKKSQPKKIFTEIDSVSSSSLAYDEIEQEDFVEEESIELKQSKDDGGLVEDVAPVASQSSAFSKSTAAKVEKNSDNYYVVLHVMAPLNKEFKGEDILNCMMKNSCRYGEMRIFHRYIRSDGQGGAYFSVASAVSPGTFNLKTMSNYTTKGLSFFMNIKQQTDSSHSLQLMLSTARKTAEQLKGIVCDDEHRPLTGRKLDEYEKRIRELSPRSR